MSTTPAFLAGITSSVIFAGSVLPMLIKAHRTKDLESYSLGNLVLANVGNAVHTVYIASLPLGPIWFLHAFYAGTSAMMLVLYLRTHAGHRRESLTPVERLATLTLAHDDAYAVRAVNPVGAVSRRTL